MVASPVSPTPMPRFVACLLVLLLALPATAQDGHPADRFAPLTDWPTPDRVRLASGAPGPDYWQQQADYTIEATLDPAAHAVAATQRITYTNHSPDALDYLWVHVEQNLFAEGSRGAAITPADSRWRGSFPEGGVAFERVELVRDGQRTGAEYMVDDTRMRIDLREPLGPGEVLALDLAWRFVIPEFGADRMGRMETAAGPIYQLAQWFPRMVVYDDVSGWNPLPYLGQGEFYLNFGTYELALTVPSDYIVMATGEQTNAEATWSAAERDRLAAARQSVERVYIVEPGEVAARAAERRGGTTTWRFRAEDVRDVAWAASPAFIVDGAGLTTPDGNDVLVLSAYPEEGVSDDPANPGWEEATRFGRHSIEHYSERWFAYPYPVAINVAGVVGGMEYPMIQFSGVDRRHMALFNVIDHELGHNWFPMIVASDERRWAWMDEGMTMFINLGSTRAFYDENPDRTIAGFGEADASRYISLTTPEAMVTFMQNPVTTAQPVMTTADRKHPAALGYLAYFKPAYALTLLRDVVLGPERFDHAFRTYVERWAFKHPQPADFFRTIEDVSGEDLAWFWRGWFYGTETLDQAVTGIEADGDASVITVAQRGLVMPVELELHFADGSTVRRTIPVEAFHRGDTFSVRAEGRVVRAIADPDERLPDVNRADNAYPRR